ncbi:MAG: hypothetical protein ABIA08_02885 [bacterium]
MKITLKGPFRKNTRAFMKDLGYYFHKKDIDTEEFMFFRPARGYPRFHIYLKEKENELLISLHLDQKKPVYQNSHAHQAEYKGKIVETEAERIKNTVL